MDKIVLYIDLIHSKISYIIAMLSSYSSLDLSKRINEINSDIDLIKKSILNNKQYIDIRNVLKLKEKLKELKGRLNDDIEVSLQGHKIACLFFECSTIIKIVINEVSLNEDYKEYLLITSEYLYNCGRIVNNEILCFENKL